MNYIFDLEQKRMVDLKLSLREVFVIYYLKQFFDSGNAVYKHLDDKRYYLITYKKLLNDLPILRIKHKQLERLLIGLEEKGIIKKHIANNKLHIYINEQKLVYDTEDEQKTLQNEDLECINNIIDTDLPTVVRYYKTRVKILFKDNPSVTQFGTDWFLKSLKRCMRFRIGKVYYESTLKNASVEVVTSNMIVLYLPSIGLFRFCKPRVFDDTVNQVFKKTYIVN